jgi:hypothetical protein
MASKQSICCLEYCVRERRFVTLLDLFDSLVLLAEYEASALIVGELARDADDWLMDMPERSFSLGGVG